VNSPSFFEELKRRSVYKVGVAYAVVAGGMELWEARGFTTLHSRRRQMPSLMRRLFDTGRRPENLLRLALAKRRKIIQRAFL
jgi:hypothetical protein